MLNQKVFEWRLNVDDDDRTSFSSVGSLADSIDDVKRQRMRRHI